MEHGECPATGCHQVPGVRVGVDQEPCGRGQQDQPARHADQVAQQGRPARPEADDAVSAPRRAVAGRGYNHGRQRYRCLARRNMLGAVGVRRKRPTRFVIPAGRRFGAAAPGFPQLAGFTPEEPVRLHLDLHTSEQAVHVERLVMLRATRAHEWPYRDVADFIVMRDPDGNEFFVIDPSVL